MSIKFQSIPTQWLGQMNLLQGILLPRLAAGQFVDGVTMASFAALAREHKPLAPEQLQAALDQIIGNHTGQQFRYPPMFHSPPQASRPLITVDGSVVVDGPVKTARKLSAADDDSSSTNGSRMHIASEEDVEAVGGVLIAEDSSPAQIQEALRVICDEGLCHADAEVVCNAAEIVSYKESESFYTSKLVSSLSEALTRLVREDPTELPMGFNAGIGAIMAFGEDGVVGEMVDALKHFADTFQGEEVIDDLLMEWVDIIAEQMGTYDGVNERVEMMFDVIVEIGKRDGDVNSTIESFRDGLRNIEGPSKFKAVRVLTAIVLERSQTSRDENSLDNFIRMLGEVAAYDGSDVDAAHLAVESFTAIMQQHPEKRNVIRSSMEEALKYCGDEAVGPILVAALNSL